MGVGYVSAGQVRQERQGDDVPRRQYRGARADLGSLTRKQVGALGEAVAAFFLQSRGASLVGRNVRVGRGELDLVVVIGGRRVAVEVKTSIAASVGDPIYHFDDRKQRQVRALARQQRAFRVDYVGVEMSASGVLVRWLPAVC